MTTSISFIKINDAIKKEVIEEIKYGGFETEEIPDLLKLFDELCNHGHIERDSYMYDELNEALIDRTWGTIFVEGGGSVIINLNAIKKE
jgi:hypothetical protein